MRDTHTHVEAGEETGVGGGGEGGREGEKKKRHTHTHTEDMIMTEIVTHTHTHIYIYIYIYACTHPHKITQEMIKMSRTETCEVDFAIQVLDLRRQPQLEQVETETTNHMSYTLSAQGPVKMI